MEENTNSRFATANSKVKIAKIMVTKVNNNLLNDLQFKIKDT